MTDYSALAQELTELLSLSHPPLAIAFRDEVPDDIPAYQSDYPPPAEDGRTGAVPAGCVFWVKGEHATFSTVPQDHGNCSVGSLTHGLISLEEAATRGDVQAVCEAKWVSPEVFPHIPVVRSAPEAIVYGPLAQCRQMPDVVLLRLNAKQAMQIHSATPEMKFEGKPQCHIVAIAKEQGQIAASVGCMLSRVRTGMSNSEMTCAIPSGKLPEIIAALKETTAADQLVAGYASQDKTRFAQAEVNA